jgi:maltose-binding protein MalE
MEAAPAEAGYEICLDGFKSGEFASWWIGSWALDSLKEAGIDYGVSPFGRPFSHVTGLFLSPNAQERGHQEAATAFMTYFASLAVQTSLALAVNTAPANREALASEAIQANADLAAFGEAAANGIPFSASPYAEAQWEPMGVAQSNMLSNLQSPADALFEAQTAVEQTIETLKNQ